MNRSIQIPSQPSKSKASESQRGGTHKATPPHPAMAKRKSGDRVSAQPDQAMVASIATTPNKGRAKPADALSGPGAYAVTGNSVSSGEAVALRAKRDAAKRMSSAGEAQNLVAVPPAAAVPPLPDAEATSTHLAIPLPAPGPVPPHQAKPSLNVTGHRPDRAPSKLAQIEALLRKDGGATIADLMTATGWQRHSVHGVLSGTFKTKRGLALTRTRAPDGTAIYAIKSQA